MAESTQAVSTANQRATAPAPHRFGGKGLTIGIIVSAVVAVVGIVLWVTQLSGGLIQTNMRNLDSWGLYITSFMFFVGLSAGGLIISSVPKTFGLKGFGGISKVAVWTSICCTVCAVAFVIIDLGQPLRLWELITSSNMTSPLMWDILVITIYLVLSIVYLWAMTSNEKGRLSDRALRVISGFAFVCAILVHSVTAWIFGLQQGREFWYTALLAPWFVSSALVCGTGLVLIVVIALRKANYLSLEQSYVNTLTKLLGAFVCVDLYFFGCDLLTEAFPGGSGLEMVQTLTVGALAPFFWIEVIGCAICAVICFVPKLRTNPLIIIASALAIAGIFCKRVQLLVGGFQTANLEYPTVINGNTITFWDQGWTGAYDGLVYWPTGLEFGIALGVVGLGALILLLGIKFLPLQPGLKKK